MLNFLLIITLEMLVWLTIAELNLHFTLFSLYFFERAIVRLGLFLFKLLNLHEIRISK
jgi:hypothetical protein